MRKETTSEKYKKMLRNKIVLDSGCWVLPKSKKMCYAAVRVNGVLRRGSTFMWAMFYKKKFPKGLCGCHRCDNPPCINPRHIFPGTLSDNQKDSFKKGRNFLGKGESHHQHKLTERDVHEIRSKYKFKVYTCPMLAKEYGISPITTWQIVNNLCWKHV